MTNFDPVFFAASVGGKLAAGLSIGDALLQAADRYDKERKEYQRDSFDKLDVRGNVAERGKTLYEFFAPTSADRAAAEYRAMIDEPTEKEILIARLTELLNEGD